MRIRNIKLTVCYDGTDYHGWQIQQGQETIQEELTRAVQSLTGSQIRVTGASRTDAGVSALGQAALIRMDSPIPTENLAKAITDRLNDDIAVIEAVEASDGFDIIGNVKNKLYRYTINTCPHRPVLKIRHCWHLPMKLDIAAMNKAAKMLVGKHDFKSFASAADNRENSVRTIFRCDVTVKGDEVYIDVEGNGFLYNMVRNIVGTLIEIGAGRWESEKITRILKAKDRTAAGPIAPAQGLCLMWIKY